MSNQTLAILEYLFEMQEWEIPMQDFNECPREPIIQGAISTKQMHSHWQTGRMQHHVDADITAHFGDSGVVPVSAFEPGDDGKLRFRPMGDISFFCEEAYGTTAEYKGAMQKLFSPIPYESHYAININLKKEPGFVGKCSEIAAPIRRYLIQRPEVEVVGELRTKDDRQTCSLVKYFGGPLLIFDRAADCYVVPPELVLGWYATVFNGMNEQQLPEFGKYKTMYEAYMPKSFVLNRKNLHIK